MIIVEFCCRDGNRDPEEVCRKQHKSLLQAVERERIIPGGAGHKILFHKENRFWLLLIYY